jgi:hypothetical protein
MLYVTNGLRTRKMSGLPVGFGGANIASKTINVCARNRVSYSTALFIDDDQATERRHAHGAASGLALTGDFAAFSFQ